VAKGNLRQIHRVVNHVVALATNGLLDHTVEDKLQDCQVLFPTFGLFTSGFCMVGFNEIMQDEEQWIRPYNGKVPSTKRIRGAYVSLVENTKLL
jgi:hypothetical protein